MFEEEKTSALPQQSAPPYAEIFPTAAALLWRDKFFICAAYPLLVIVSLCVISLPSPSFLIIFSASILERMLQMTFMYLVFTRWIKILSTGPRKIGMWPTLRYFLFGLVLWGCFAIPFMLSVTFPESAMPMVTFVLIGTFCWIALRYFFYPLPILLGCRPFKKCLAIAADVNRGTRALPIKLLIAPAGFLLLLTAVAMSPSPDARLGWVNYAVNAVMGVFWVFAGYLSLAASLLRLDEQVWRENHLDPYRTARLSTLEFQGSSWLARQLKPKYGWGWIAFGALVWIGNWTRLSTMAPAGTLEVEKIEIAGPNVSVAVHMSDSEYHFRGFDPINFALAGEARAVIAHAPESIKQGDSAAVPSNDLSFTIPDDVSDIHLQLNFTANRSGKDLSALKDLYLWYRSAKMQHLEMDKATITTPN